MDFIFVKSQKEGMDGYGSVYARIRNANGVKKFNTGYQIKKEEWEEYRSGKYNATATLHSINLRYGVFANVLEQIKGYLEEATDYKKAKEIIRSIKESIISSMERTERKKKVIRSNHTLLVDYIKEIRKEYETGERTKLQSSETVSKCSLKQLSHLICNLEKFEADCECRFTLDEIDMEWQQEFVSWCMNVPLATNTINTLMYNLRKSLRIANESKLTQNEVYLTKGFVPNKEVVDYIFLNPEQIKAMYELDISTPEAIRKLADATECMKDDVREEMERQLKSHKHNTIEIARDVFMVGCFTGQRLSDYSRINISMIKTIKGRKFIDIVQKKTGKEVFIPMDKRVKAILDKYKGQLPHIKPELLNYNIKIIGELLGWTWKPRLEGNVGKSYKGSRFCDMISSHTARRSFATNAYMAKVPLASIMAITGHSTEEKFRIYLKQQLKEDAVLAAKDFSNIMKPKTSVNNKVVAGRATRTARMSGNNGNYYTKKHKK